MNRHISTSTGLVILVLILFAVGIAIWAQLPREEATVEDSDPIQQKIETNNDTTASSPQQNIYRSEKYGFQITLPATWVVEESEDGLNFYSPERLLAVKKALEENKPVGIFVDLFVTSTNDEISTSITAESAKITKNVGSIPVVYYRGGIVFEGHVYEIHHSGITYYFLSGTNDTNAIADIIKSIIFTR